jgi:hypothetical protein
MAIAVAFGVAAPAGAEASAGGWSAAFDVSRSAPGPLGREGIDLDVASDGRAIIAWTEGTGAAVRVRYALRAPGASRFGPALAVPVPSGRGQRFPRVAIVRSGAAAIAWQEGTGYPSRIRVARRSPAGILRVVTVRRPDGRPAVVPRIDMNEAGAVALAWRAATPGVNEDGVAATIALPGRPFASPTLLGPRRTSASEVAIDAAGNVAVAWLDSVRGPPNDPETGVSLAIAPRGGGFRRPIAASPRRRTGQVVRRVREIDLRAARAGFVLAYTDFVENANAVRDVSAAGALGAPARTSPEGIFLSLAVAPSGAALLAAGDSPNGTSGVRVALRPAGGPFGAMTAVAPMPGDSFRPGSRPAVAAVADDGTALVANVALRRITTQSGPSEPTIAAAAAPGGAPLGALTPLSRPGERVQEVAEPRAALASTARTGVVAWVALGARGRGTLRAATWSPTG